MDKKNKTITNNQSTPEPRIAQADQRAIRQGQLAHILIKPLVTEKATAVNQLNQYIFVVDKKANKIDIAKAIKVFYGIDPVAVNIINMPGKKVVRGRIKGQRSDWKKAMITLPAGKTIQIYEGV